MMRQLHQGWVLRHVDGPVPDAVAARLREGVDAVVPGVVHLDLQRLDLIEDPLIDDAESRLHWIGQSDWEYRTTFEWHPDGHDRHDLVTEGLDTVATVELNGQVVGTTFNQMRSYRFDVGSHLREGANELTVTFASPIAYAYAEEARLGKRPHSNKHPFHAIRKMACNFGWDWGPDLATSGIWRPIGLESWSGARIASVRPVTSIDGDAASLTAHVTLEWAPGADAEATLSASVAGRTAEVAVAPGQTVCEIELTGLDVKRWCPRTHGAQPRYALTVELAGPSEDRWERLVGFRTAEVRMTPEMGATEFCFVINGEDVFVRGANWIPDDVFAPRITEASTRRALMDAVDAGMNMIRVWGGGMFEPDYFYDLCDELGLMVWQDFLLGCSAYSEDEALWAEIEAESREAVTRLVSHPSLVMLNGGNENVWSYVDWEWRAVLEGRTWGERYVIELFPEIVAELAPGVPYSENSPFSYNRYLHPNDPAHGCMHIWDVWNNQDYSHYASYRPRFVSEFGFQGPPARSTLAHAVHDDPPSPTGPMMMVHQKAGDGALKLERGLGDHLPQPESFEDWHWATQLNQARAIRFGIAHFRSLFPYNTGAIVWQLNDCWPVVSWAAVDSHGHRKPLWFALREVFADRLLQVRVGDAGAELLLHNDSPVAVSGEVVVARITLGGGELATASIQVDLPPRSAGRWELGPELATPGDAATEFLFASGLDTRAVAWFVEDPRLALTTDFEATASATEGGYVVELSARTVIKDAFVMADLVHPEAAADTGLITVLPGERARIVISAPAGLDAARFASPEVLRSANDLIAGSRPVPLGGDS